jgi:hypothetical protein
VVFKNAGVDLPNSSWQLFMVPFIFSNYAVASSAIPNGRSRSLIASFIILVVTYAGRLVIRTHPTPAFE